MKKQSDKVTNKETTTTKRQTRTSAKVLLHQTNKHRVGVCGGTPAADHHPVQVAAAVATVGKCPMIRKTATSVEYDDGYVTDPRPLAARGCRAVTTRRQC